jgi:pyruvate/2-oxoglutarate dehydrogenase complex dihydrolipoamide dehydrogenase (E3) component
MTQRPGGLVAGHPDDERLLAELRPPGWTNPAPKGRYHLVVLGAGTAGLVAAAGAAGLGARVALVERHLMGGDCLNTGCVPSKALLEGARRGGSFPEVMDWMRQVRADLAPADGAARFRALGVDLFLGDGAFTGRDTLQVGGAMLRFRRAVIATGSRPVLPPIPGLDAVEAYTSDTIFSLTELPERLLVLGGGAAGCELAQGFARLGSRVTLLEREARLLPGEDAEASRVIESSLRRDGVAVIASAGVSRALSDGGAPTLALAGGEVVSGDVLLVATGRQPNLTRLGLEAAGVALRDGRLVLTDRLQTTNRRIFAAGDVVSGQGHTHAADFQARAVIANALFFGRSRVRRLVTPRVIYTAPELAVVGEVADAARHDVITIPLEEVDRARLAGETEGFLRVALRKGSDTIAGVTIVAPHAGEMIGEAVLAMTRGIGLVALASVMHPYPTVAEAYRKAADLWRRGRLTPWVRRVLAVWFRLTS